jgi:hypothetical protein
VTLRERSAPLAKRFVLEASAPADRGARPWPGIAALAAAGSSPAHLNGSRTRAKAVEGRKARDRRPTNPTPAIRRKSPCNRRHGAEFSRPSEEHHMTPGLLPGLLLPWDRNPGGDNT